MINSLWLFCHITRRTSWSLGAHLPTSPARSPPRPTIAGFYYPVPFLFYTISAGTGLIPLQLNKPSLSLGQFVSALVPANRGLPELDKDDWAAARRRTICKCQFERTGRQIYYLFAAKACSNGMRGTKVDGKTGDKYRRL